MEGGERLKMRRGGGGVEEEEGRLKTRRGWREEDVLRREGDGGRRTS